jgi:hypothetical protein
MLEIAAMPIERWARESVMRVSVGTIGAIGLAAVLLGGCGDSPKQSASKAAGGIASIAEPRNALAASAEKLAKDSFALEYAFTGAGSDAGNYLVAREGDKSAIRGEIELEGDRWEFGYIRNGAGRYVCVRVGATPYFQALKGCALSSDSRETDDPTSTFFDAGKLIDELVEDEEAEISDGPDQRINGIDSRCFAVTSDKSDGTVCIAKDDGRLVQVKGRFEGEQTELTLTGSRDPKPGDFELPYPVVDEDELFGGGGDVDDDNDDPAIVAPAPPAKPGLPAVRIAGEPYPWEGSPACPGFEFYFDTIAVDAAGAIYFPGVEGIRKLAPDCTLTAVLPASDDFYIRVAIAPDGTLYAARLSGSEQSVVVRIDASGAETIIAGKECAATDSKDCPVPKQAIDGSATAHYLGPTMALAAGADGTVWFVEHPFDEDETLDARLRKVMADGSMTTVPAKTLADSRWSLSVALDAVGSAWVSSFSGRLTRIAQDRTTQRFDDAGGDCLAIDATGAAWSHDTRAGELVVTRPDGTQVRHAYAPSEGAFCTALAFLPSGDLVFATFDGLWRVEVP